MAGDEIRVLATAYDVSEDALREAEARGLLLFRLHRGAPCWRFGDLRNGCFRRMDGRPFRIGCDAVKAEAATRGSEWHRLIGLEDVVTKNRRDLVITPEGSKDAIAAFHFADVEGTLKTIGIVAGLGSATKICADDLQKFRGRRVRIVNDADQAGRGFVEREGPKLATVAAEVQVFELTGLVKVNGDQVKDLADLLGVCGDDFERERDLWDITILDSKGPRIRVIPATAELSFSGGAIGSETTENLCNTVRNGTVTERHIPQTIPACKPNGGEGFRAVANTEDSENSEFTEDSEGEEAGRKKAFHFTSRKSKPRRGRPPGVESRVLDGCIPTARGQTQKLLWKLTRALAIEEHRSGRPLLELRVKCVKRWRRLARGKCDPKWTVEHVLSHIENRIRRVRTPVSKMEEAIAAAEETFSSHPAVCHPLLKGRPARERLARICRIMGEHGPFLLTMRAAARILDAPSPSTGHDHLSAMEGELIRCVERGIGKPGSLRASIYEWIGPSP